MTYEPHWFQLLASRFFIPIFLLGIGLLTKFAASWITQKVFGYSAYELMVM